MILIISIYLIQIIQYVYNYFLDKISTYIKIRMFRDGNMTLSQSMSKFDILFLEYDTNQ